MENISKALQDEFGVDQEFHPAEYDSNVWVSDDGEWEVLVLSESELDEYARRDFDDLVDELGIDSFSEDFQDWIIRNACDEEAVKEAYEEQYYSYADDIKRESDEEYGNRLTQEMVETGTVTEEEAKSEGFNCEDHIDDFVNIMVDTIENPVKEYYFEFGKDGFKWLDDNQGIVDWDKVFEEMISIDGYGHSLATYDGEEHELESDNDNPANNMYAYLLNRP